MTKDERLRRQEERQRELFGFDCRMRERGVIAGVDEVGRGPLAGPVVAACVVLPEDFCVLGIDDSKRVSEKRREALYKEIIDGADAYGIGCRDNRVIDEINILEATKQAMADAIREADRMLRERTGRSIDLVLIDAVHLEQLDIPQESIIKGDATSLSIAAASIVAKVTRDREMIAYDDIYSGYGFAKNKGYGTRAHYDGIRAQGITPIHRRSFLKNLEQEEN